LTIYYRFLIQMSSISLMLAMSNIVYGQNFDDLYQLYQNNDFTRLKSEFAKIGELDSKNLYEYRFFEALLNNNAEEAKSIYEQIYSKSKGKVKLLAAEKLRQYYYARGYYLTAADYQKYVVKHEDQLPEREDEPIKVPDETVQSSTDLSYFIQVGAFGLSDNANQLKNMLETQNINCSIVEKNISNTRLYCVWIKGKSNLESTIDYANIIKERYDLNYRIIKE